MIPDMSDCIDLLTVVSLAISFVKFSTGKHLALFKCYSRALSAIRSMSLILTCTLHFSAVKYLTYVYVLLSNARDSFPNIITSIVCSLGPRDSLLFLICYYRTLRTVYSISLVLI